MCRQFGRYGPVSHAVIDRSLGRALVYFDNMDNATYAVNEMRGRIINGKKIQVSFNSRIYFCKTFIQIYDKAFTNHTFLDMSY